MRIAARLVNLCHVEVVGRSEVMLGAITSVCVYIIGNLGLEIASKFGVLKSKANVEDDNWRVSVILRKCQVNSTVPEMACAILE